MHKYLQQFKKTETNLPQPFLQVCPQIIETEKQKQGEETSNSEMRKSSELNMAVSVVWQQESDYSWEDDSDNSACSFQAGRIQQHTFCLEYMFSKIVLSEFKSYSILNPLEYQQVPKNMEMDLGDFLEYQNRLLPIHDVHLFDEIILNDRKLMKLLEWIYARAPQVYVEDLIFIFRNIAIWHHRNKMHYWQVQNLLEVVDNLDFMKTIFDDEHLEILKFQIFQEPLKIEGSIEKSTIPYLMKFFSLTLLLILEGNFHHPSYEAFQGLKKEEEKKREELKLSKMSKKIKKEKL